MKYPNPKNKVEANLEEHLEVWKKQVAEQQQFHKKIGRHLKMIFTEKKIFDLQQDLSGD